MTNVFLAHNFQYNRDSQQRNSYPKFYVRKLENNNKCLFQLTQKSFFKFAFSSRLNRLELSRAIQFLKG